MARDDEIDAVELFTQLGGLISPDLDAYIAGTISSPTCVLCQHRPCDCPPFGTPEYIALVHQRHRIR